MINSRGLAGEEGVHRVTVAGIDRGRPHRTAQTARRGGEPTRISPVDDDP